MTEVATWAQPVTVSARDLTYGEVADLDRLRAVLASAVDRTQPAAISWLWDSMITAHAGHRAPAGFVEAVATAVGDLLAVHVPSVRWSVWPGPAGLTLGVASKPRPHAPVLPFIDAQERWDARAQDWIVEYLARAAAHLTGAAVPQQRLAPDDDAPVPASARPAQWSPPEQLAPAHDEPDTFQYQPAALVTRDAHGADGAPQESRVPHEPSQGRAAAAAVPFAPDVPLQDFALDALDHAMSLLRATGAFDREVFVLLVDGAGRRTQSCPGGPAVARSRALEAVRASGAGRAAVTWIDRNPADLPGPRQTFAAVLVDAWDAGGEGVRVGCRFVDDVLGTGPLGRPLVVGPVARLL